MIAPWNDEEYRCGCSAIFNDILIDVLDNGQYLLDMPSHRDIRKFVLNQLKNLVFQP